MERLTPRQREELGGMTDSRDGTEVGVIGHCHRKYEEGCKRQLGSPGDHRLLLVKGSDRPQSESVRLSWLHGGKNPTQTLQIYLCILEFSPTSLRDDIQIQDCLTAIGRELSTSQTHRGRSLERSLL